MAIDYGADEKKSVMTAGEKQQQQQPYIRSDDVWMFRANVIAVVALTRAFSKLLIAAKGTIAITGNGASRVQVLTNATYNATKAAVETVIAVLRHNILLITDRRAWLFSIHTVRSLHVEVPGIENANECLFA